jgi:hypothetical protein
VIAVAIPFLVYLWVFYCHFYVNGAYLLDSGLFAAILWRSGNFLQLPQVIGERSYFCDHFAPFWSIFSRISELLPVSPPDYFAFILAGSYALLAAYVYLTLRVFYRETGSSLQDTALSIGFAFNGFCLVMADFPHLEILLPGLHLIFYSCLLQRRWLWTGLVFCLALLLREDSGFHFTAILGLLSVWSACTGRPRALTFRLLLLSLLAFAYSALALLVARSYFPGPITLSKVYFGQPFWSHLSLNLLASRLGCYLSLRAYWSAPVLLLLFCAWRQRQWPLALGSLAFLPWLLLHWTACYEIPGSLSGYYGFPFLISMGWVLLAPLWTNFPIQLDRQRQGQTRRLFAGILLLSWLGCWGQAHSLAPALGKLTRPSSWSRRTPCQEFLSQYWSRQRISEVVASEAVLALHPAAFSGVRRCEHWAGRDRPKLVLAWEGSDDWEELRYYLRAQGYRMARWRDTPILAGVPNDQPLPQEPGWLAIPWLPLIARPIHAHLESDAWHCPAAAAQIALSLRSLNLEPGRYRLELDVSQPEGEQTINLAVFTHPGCFRVRDYPLSVRRGRSKLDFEFVAEKKRYEIILESPPSYPLRVHDIHLTAKLP